MTNEEFLTEVRRRAAAGEVSRSELLAAFSAGRPETAEHRRFAVSRALYVVGGVIVLLGLVFLVQQNWAALSSLVRVLVTLGAAGALYIAGAILVRAGHATGSGPIFLFLAALLAPTGVLVALHEAGVEWWHAGSVVLQSGMFTIFYALSLVALRQSFFAPLAVIAGTTFYYALITWFLPETVIATLRIDLIYEYATLLLGIIYLLLGFGSAQTKVRQSTEALYFLGLLAFFGAAFPLAGTGFKTVGNLIWEVFLPGCAVGAVFLSIPLRSRAFLFLGALALAGDIIKLTSEHFPDVLGWPITLVITGFVIIAIGYGTLLLHKRYLAKNASLGASSMPA